MAARGPIESKKSDAGSALRFITKDPHSIADKRVRQQHPVPDGGIFLICEAQTDENHPNMAAIPVVGGKWSKIEGDITNEL
ncbi:hypothetical protein DDT54_01960 [Brenneria nigrifluens DSM 30175 = ATCC 13028]|uniref:Uncharacterized protein n=1 Tax=Brenneria nigrifluens DSM 30175 = ATCC 13028 TaxID=1121120 RepID=A0A2U1UWW6_9GAMM|nr:hypothetical protein DDT54_01960 [Brenneria nigrifluens DSM 30175 = ATCC 13028]